MMDVFFWQLSLSAVTAEDLFNCHRAGFRFKLFVWHLTNSYPRPIACSESVIPGLCVHFRRGILRALSKYFVVLLRLRIPPSHGDSHEANARY